MIKVIHLQNSSTSAGGVVPQLNRAFLESDIDSSILTLNPNINDNKSVIHLGRIPKVISRIDSIISDFIFRNRKRQFGQFSYPFLGTNVSRIDQVKNADIIYLHWINFGFLNLRNIEQLLRLKKPVFIFMHDMWSITGGCHYSFSCEKFKSRCNDCQIFSGNKKSDWSSRQFNKKLKLYSKYDNLYFISPSKWLYNCAQLSLLTKNKPIFCIPNIINKKVYKPFDKKIARQILDLNVTDTIIAFGAVTIDSPYKGWVYFRKALEILKSDHRPENVTILIFGSISNEQIANEIPFKTKFLGYLSDEYSGALAFNAADVFAAPSLADNLPTTILQSLHCGTPVVGFDTGGIPDMIKHMNNGYLAKYKDEVDLANGIQYCLMNKLEMVVPIDFDNSKIIEQHINLIRSIKF